MDNHRFRSHHRRPTQRFASHCRLDEIAREIKYFGAFRPNPRRRRYSPFACPRQIRRNRGSPAPDGPRPAHYPHTPARPGTSFRARAWPCGAPGWPAAPPTAAVAAPPPGPGRGAGGGGACFGVGTALGHAGMIANRMGRQQGPGERPRQARHSEPRRHPGHAPRPRPDLARSATRSRPDRIILAPCHPLWQFPPASGPRFGSPRILLP